MQSVFVYTPIDMNIDFDPKKHQANLDNPSRRLGFDRAADFDWGNAVIDEDTRKDYSERRFVAVGYLDGRHAYHVLHADFWRCSRD